MISLNVRLAQMESNIYGILWSIIEGPRERSEHLDIFLFTAHHSMAFYFWFSVYCGRAASDFVF